MNEFNKTVARGGVREDVNIDAGLRDHMNRVFGYMMTGMLISAAVSYGLSLNPALVASLFTGFTKWIVMLLPLALVFGFGAAAKRLSASGALAFFYLIAASIGVSFSMIFLIFSTGSLVTTFLTTAVMFGAMALFGYTTKRDLSSWGRFLMMALIGIIAASIINIFMGSMGIQFAVSVLGVLIFAGFTAYDTQNIKNTYLQYRHVLPADEIKKAAIFGALNLYLDFVNLFQFLLQFMGSDE